MYIYKMLYSCDACNYETNNKCKFNRHNISQRHMQRINNVNHDLYDENNDLKQQIVEYKLQLKDKECETKIMEKECENIKKISKIKEKSKNNENEYLKQILNKAGTMIKGISPTRYILTNFQDAPPIKEIDDYSIIMENQTNDEFVESLIYAYNHNNLDSLISKLIAKIYKKNNIRLQSIWNTDRTRLVYIMKQLLEDNTTNWIKDNGGIKTTCIIVKPLLNFLRETIVEYIGNSKTVYENCKMSEIEIYALRFDIASKILLSIDNCELEKKVIKSLAPELYLDKNVYLKSLK
jgi:hypothetical protein